MGNLLLPTWLSDQESWFVVASHELSYLRQRRLCQTSLRSVACNVGTRPGLLGELDAPPRERMCKVRRRAREEVLCAPRKQRKRSEALCGGALQRSTLRAPLQSPFISRHAAESHRLREKQKQASALDHSTRRDSDKQSHEQQRKRRVEEGALVGVPHPFHWWHPWLTPTGVRLARALHRIYRQEVQGNGRLQAFSRTVRMCSVKHTHTYSNT